MADLPDVLERDIDGMIAFRGHRIRLIEVAARFDEGHSAEGIVVDYYPTLSLASVYKAIAYFLEHEEEVRKEMRANQEASDELERRPRTGPTLEQLRQRMQRLKTS